MALALLYFNRFSALVNVVLWWIPLLYILYGYIFYNKIPQYPMYSIFKISLLLIGAITSFVLANVKEWNEMIEPERSQIYPTAPETDYYWLFHSLWHLLSQFAISYLFTEKIRIKVL